MKKLLLSLLAMLSLVCWEASATGVIFEVTKAGTLADKLTGHEEETTVAIKGPINYLDLKNLGAKLPKLQSLDLTEASFEKYSGEDWDLYYQANYYPSSLMYCTTLEHLILPESTKGISTEALYGCLALKTVTILAKAVPEVEYGSLGNPSILKNCTLRVPADLVDAYKAAKSKGWCFGTIVAIPASGGSTPQSKVALRFSVRDNAQRFTIRTTDPETAVQVVFPDGFTLSTKTNESGSILVEHQIDAMKIASGAPREVTVSAAGVRAFEAQTGGLTSFVVEDGGALKNIMLKFMPLVSLDLTPCPQLVDLNLDHCEELTTLSLAASGASLERLILSNTKVTQVDYAQATKLKELDLTAVGISSINLAPFTLLETLSLADNKLQTVSLAGLKALKSITLSRNQLTSFATEAAKLDNLSLDENQIAEINLDQQTKISFLSLERNRFTLATLPAKGTKILGYTYAPQAPYSLPESAPFAQEIDLSMFDNLLGVLKTAAKSTFKWYDATTKALLESDTDYSETEGKFTFKKAFPNGIYCVITTKAFPLFKGNNAYQTTTIKLLEGEAKPNFLFTAGKKVINFSVKTSPGQAVRVVYADGEEQTEIGDEDMGIARFYHAHKTEMTSYPTKIFSEDMLSFSAVDLGITAIDPINCPKLIRLILKAQNLTTLNLDKVTTLQELYVDGNADLEQLDVTKLPHLTYLAVSNNAKMTKIDLSRNPLLESFYAFNTKLANVDLSHNTLLRALDLTNTGTNQLSLAALTELSVLHLADNHLESLDIDRLAHLTEVDLGHNRLTELTLNSSVLKTLLVGNNKLERLTLPRQHAITQLDCSNNALTLDALPTLDHTAVLYTYAPQAQMILPKQIGSDPLDFSKMASLQGVLTAPVPTQFAWVSQDDKPLVEGQDFFVRGGVISFKDGVSSHGYFVMTTKAFPDFSGEKAFRTVPTWVHRAVALEEVVSSDLDVQRVGSQVRVQMAEEVTYRLYTLTGECLASGLLCAGDSVVMLPSEDAHYILRIGDTAIKI